MAVRSRKFYDLLELKTTTPSEEELKKAYKKAAMKFHPDRNPEQPEVAEKKFKQISEAYQTLSDPRQKQIYDQLGEQGLQNGGGGASGRPPHGSEAQPFGSNMGDRGARGSRRHFTPGFGRDSGADPFDLFNEMMAGRDGRRRAGAGMGGMGGRGRFQDRSAPDFKAVVNNTLNCTLEQLYAGCTKKMKITKTVVENVTGQQSRVEKVLDIEVQPGWKKGTKITFAGEGDDPGEGGRAQDIVFTIEEKLHSYFSRDGDNLIFKAKVTSAQASKGLKITVPHLDGRNVTVHTTAGEVSHGRLKVIAGEGMPIRKQPGAFGNMIIKFEVQR